MSEERLALMRAYLRALKRIEESAAGVAFELDLPRLRCAILEDLILIEQQIFDLAESEPDDDE